MKQCEKAINVYSWQLNVSDPSKDANNQHVYQNIYKQQKALRYLKSCIKSSSSKPCSCIMLQR